MSNEVVETTIVDVKNLQENALVKAVNESGLDKTKSQILLDKFIGYFEVAAKWEATEKSLVITDSSQLTEMKMAREGRLFLAKKRVDVDKTRKELKEDSLREGQTIDAIAKILTNLIKPIEESLEQKEKFAEIQEAKRKSELKLLRQIELSPFVEFVPEGIDLGFIKEESYQSILNGAKLQMKAKFDAEQKIEVERIAKIEAERIENERIRVENERLKIEAEAKEKLLKEERAKANLERKLIEEKAAAERKLHEEQIANERKIAEEKARKERESAELKLKTERESAKAAAEKAAAERVKIELELRVKKDAEEKANRDVLEAERKAKAAPDKEKLLKLASQLRDCGLPEVQSQDAKKVIDDVKLLLEKITVFITKKVGEM